jgi:integrase
MSVSLAVILDSRRQKENQTYPVKLRVNHQRITNYYPTIFDLSKEAYEKLSAPRISTELQDIRTKLRQIEREAEEAVKELAPFSFQEFEQRYVRFHPLFRQRKPKHVSVPAAPSDDFDYSPYQRKFPILLETKAEPGTLTFSYRHYIQRLVREGRISTAVSYHCSYVSLTKFSGNVPFVAVTPSFLLTYEQKMKREGVTKSTLGFYLRALRAVYNEAVEAGLVRKDKTYPFGKRKYQIPSSRKVKKALQLSEMEKIYYLSEEQLSETEQRCRAYWLFSYFGNGMNPKDMAFLRYSNIHEDYLVFERAKTERSTREDPKPITVYLTEDMKAIMERWGNRPALPNTYIFPILQEGITPLRQYTLIKNLVHLTNDCMQEVVRRAGVEKKATTYVARHTFSTVLKRSGASTEAIQEALGHTNIKTTESYLDSFDRDTIRELAGRLSAFKSKEPYE